jgi:hypothetical protein
MLAMDDTPILVMVVVNLMNLSLRPRLAACFTVMEPLASGKVASVAMVP